MAAAVSTAACSRPGTRSFEERAAVAHIDCRGFRLFTPGAGQGGRYSFEVTPQGRGIKRFRLQVARANTSETAPGIALGNYAHAHGRSTAEACRCCACTGWTSRATPT